jgi:hypothetical protein
MKIRNNIKIKIKIKNRIRNFIELREKREDLVLKKRIC